MTKTQRLFTLILRLALGWLFLYAGLTKVLDPEWTSVGFLRGAKNLTGFYSFLAEPAILPIVDFFNQWGLTILGISLIVGFLVRVSAPLGAALMILYWLPRLENWMPDDHSLIVDQHVVFAAALLLLAALNAGKLWGFDKKIFG